MKKMLFFTLSSLLFAPFAQAGTPKVLGEYGDWTAYYDRDSSGPVCYMASSPKRDEGKYTSRGSIYTVVTHRPNEKSYDVITINAGYTYKPASAVEIKIGTQTFGENELFTSGGKAWAINTAADKKIVAAMKRGSRMIVNGTSSKGTKTKDTYSLDGFSSAYKAISNKCK
ncbi:MAG: hypothetical protein IJ184_06500 [Alphaproteobacteria bacterium]|nr:hypothetical protein [Alphaproteobacteria bacterium]